MKYIIKDVNKKEVLSTEDIKEAYKYLKNVIPSKNLPTEKHMRGSINYDKKWGKDPVPYGFLGEDDEEIIMYMDVFYN
jgi:hypothetical protein